MATPERTPESIEALGALLRDPLLLIGLALLVATHAYRLTVPPLEYDEVLSVIFSSQSLWPEQIRKAAGIPLPVPTLPLVVWSYDTHPPLYYLSLHVWMWLGQSDLWVRLSSVAISMASGLALALACRRFVSRRSAGIALGLYALAPVVVYYGQQVRMYGMLMLATSIAMYGTLAILEAGWLWRRGLLIVAAGFLAVHSHGAGFLLLAGIGVAGLGMALLEPRDRARWLGTGGCAVASGVLAAPWLFLASRRTPVTHTQVADVGDLLRDTFSLVFGRYAAASGWSPVEARGIFLALLLVAIFAGSKRGGFLFASYGLGPVAACFVLSQFRPIWLVRTIALVAPAVVFGLAMALEAGAKEISALLKKNAPNGASGLSALRMASGALGALCVVAAGWGLALQYAAKPTVSGFAESAAYLAENAQPGEAVILPGPRDLWGIAWYLGGLDSMDILDKGRQRTTTDGGLVLSTKASTLNSDERTRIAWVVGQGWRDFRPISRTHDLKSEKQFRIMSLYRATPKD